MSSLPPERLFISRLTFGPRANDETLGRSPPELRSWLLEQLSPPQDDDQQCRDRLEKTQLRLRHDAGRLANGQAFPAINEMRPLSTLNAPIEDIWSLTDYNLPMGRAARVRPRLEVTAACLTRAIFSHWQLRELIVDFWHNHFNVDAGDAVQVAVALPTYDREVIRRHALGNFRELLEAVASSTAMLYYLNNRSSRAGKANENYARELFELHTLGREHYLNDNYRSWRDVPGALKGKPTGFIDEDVYEASRSFTGWAVSDGSIINGSERLPSTGRFAYIDSWHDNYQKRVLGTEFESFQEPLADGKKVLDLVANHPATAVHMSAKLCRRLVGKAASPRLIEATASQWQKLAKHPKQIARAIEFIVSSPDFGRSQGERLRRPLELVAAFARATNMDFTPTEPLFNEIANAGQRLFTWSLPTGHPEETDYWLSTNGMRCRWRLIQGLANNQWGNGIVNPLAGLELHNTSLESVANSWAKRLLGVEPGSPEVRSILGALSESNKANLSPSTPENAKQILSLLAMSPAFQTV